LAKIKIFGKNQNFESKSEFSSKIKIFDQNLNFWRKSKFLAKIKIFGENQNFWQKSKFWIKIWIFLQNKNFRSKSEFSIKISVTFAQRKSNKFTALFFLSETLTEKSIFLPLLISFYLIMTDFILYMNL